MDAYRDQYAKLFNGGKDVTLLAISTDAIGELAAWAKDAGYPFTFLSDSGGKVGQLYGTFNPAFRLDKRTAYVIDSTGTIVHVAAPFREVDPTAYTALGEAVAKARGGP